VDRSGRLRVLADARIHELSKFVRDSESSNAGSYGNVVQARVRSAELLPARSLCTPPPTPGEAKISSKSAQFVSFRSYCYTHLASKYARIYNCRTKENSDEGVADPTPFSTYTRKRNCAYEWTARYASPSLHCRDRGLRYRDGL